MSSVGTTATTDSGRRGVPAPDPGNAPPATLLCETPSCSCDDPTLCGTREPYVYVWGNNSRRAELKGRPCVIEATGRMGTALIRFVDTGERVTTSRRALRRQTYPEIA